MSFPDLKAVPGHPFRTIFAYLRPYAKEYLLGAMLSLVFVLVGLAMPLVIESVVNRFEDGTMNAAALKAYFAFLIAIAAVTGLGRYYQRWLMISASRKAEYDFRNDYFRHVQQLGQDFFHRTPTGDIMARSVNDLNYVRMFMGPGIMGSADMVRLPLSLALMIHFSPTLTLVACLPMPFVSLMVYSFIMFMHRQSKVVQEQFSKVTSRVQENLAGARVVKAHSAAEREQTAFRKESAAYMRDSLKLAVVMNFAWVSIGTCVGLTILLVLWRGGLLVIDNRLPSATSSASSCAS